MKDKPFEEFVVKEGDKEMTVIIAGARDKEEAAYLKEAETEKTRKELRDKPSKPKSTMSKADISGNLKEIMEHKKRQKSDHPRKYW